MEAMRYFLLRPTLLLLRVLAFLPLFSSAINTQAEVARHVLNGTVGGIGLLSVTGQPGDIPVSSIRWFLLFADTNKVRLGDSKGRVFEPYNDSLPNFPWIRRLHMYNETTLMFGNMTMGDAGVYEAEVWLHNGSVYKEQFHVNIYGPYPRSRAMVYIVLAILGILAVLLMISVFLWRRKEKKKMKRKIEGPVPAETEQEELVS